MSDAGYSMLGAGARWWPREMLWGPIPKKGNAKECSNYRTIALISHASKVMLKILQARLQQYMNSELPDVQTGFRKARVSRDQIANIHWRKDWCWSWSSNILATWGKELTHWKRSLCCKRLKAKGEGGDRKDEIVRQHHWLNGLEFEQSPGDNDG